MHAVNKIKMLAQQKTSMIYDAPFLSKYKTAPGTNRKPNHTSTEQSTHISKQIIWCWYEVWPRNGVGQKLCSERCASGTRIYMQCLTKPPIQWTPPPPPPPPTTTHKWWLPQSTHLAEILLKTAVKLLRLRAKRTSDARFLSCWASGLLSGVLWFRNWKTRKHNL